jgi:hypothetical protein
MQHSTCAATYGDNQVHVINIHTAHIQQTIKLNDKPQVKALHIIRKNNAITHILLSLKANTLVLNVNTRMITKNEYILTDDRDYGTYQLDDGTLVRRNKAKIEHINVTNDILHLKQVASFPYYSGSLGPFFIGGSNIKQMILCTYFGDDRELEVVETSTKKSYILSASPAVAVHDYNILTDVCCLHNYPEDTSRSLEGSGDILYLCDQFYGYENETGTYVRRLDDNTLILCFEDAKYLDHNQNLIIIRRDGKCEIWNMTEKRQVTTFCDAEYAKLG